MINSQSPVMWGLFAITITSVGLTLQRGLRGIFPEAKSLSAIVGVLGSDVFLTKLATVLQGSARNLSFIPAYFEAQLLALDVHFAQNMLVKACQLGVVVILVRACSRGRTRRFAGKIRQETREKVNYGDFRLTDSFFHNPDVLYALFGILQLYILTLTRVWNTPLFLIFGLQTDLLCKSFESLLYLAWALVCTYLPFQQHLTWPQCHSSRFPLHVHFWLKAPTFPSETPRLSARLT